MKRTPMPPLWLDYQSPKPGHQRPGLLLLGISLLLGGALFWLALTLSGQIDQAEQAVSRLRQDAERQRLSARSEGAAPDRQTGSAAQAGERWESLFTVLEKSGDEALTLLSLTPGPREIVITGEARHTDAVLAYVQRLQNAAAAQQVLGQIHLVKYEVVAEHPYRPVRFTLQATWGGATP